MSDAQLHENMDLEDQTPDVTVVIPLFNKHEFVTACLESVLSQSGICFEVICIDDCSTDGSFELVEQLAERDPRLRLIKNSLNRGAAYCRNLGIQLARGRFLQFTDADDLLPTRSLITLVEIAERTNSDVVKGTLQTLLEDVVVAPWPAETIKQEKVGTLLDLPEIWIPWFHPCCLISRELLICEKITYPLLIAGEDPVFLAKVLSRAKQISITPRATYIYRPNNFRPIPNPQIITDYITHVQNVKSLYAGKFKSCWNAYRIFIKDDLVNLISQGNISEAESKSFKTQIQELLDFPIVNKSWVITRPFRNFARILSNVPRISEILTYIIIRRSGIFDTEYYLSNNPDVKLAKIDPILHFIRYGNKENRNPSWLFETRFYMENNADVVNSTKNPLVHYIKYGGFEGRDPGPNFYSAWYLQTYTDVKNARVNPLIHYLKFGKNEGRLPKPD